MPLTCVVSLTIAKDGSTKMIKLKAKQRRKQKGAILVWVLIVLALTSTAVAGLLYYVNTSVLVHGKEIDRMEGRYAADAGMEWFIAELLADDGMDRFRNPQDVGDDLWNEAGLGTVNEVTPSVVITEFDDSNAALYRYTVESTTEGERVTATFLQSVVGGTVIINVTSWEIS